MENIKTWVMVLATVTIPAAVVALVADTIDRPRGRSYLERFLMLTATMIVGLIVISLLESRHEKKKRSQK